MNVHQHHWPHVPRWSTSTGFLVLLVSLLSLAVLGSSLVVVRAADFGGLTVGSMKQNPPWPTDAPVEIRDQFNAGAMNNSRTLEINNGSGFSNSGGPTWSETANWQINSSALRYNGGANSVAFARTPWLSTSSDVSADIVNIPNGNNNVRFGIAMLGHATQVSALTASIFKSGGNQISLEIGYVNNGTYVAVGTPVVVGNNSTLEKLLLQYDATTRIATASYNGETRTYTVPVNPPWNAGIYTGAFSNLRNANYRLDNFQATYPSSAAVVSAQTQITSDWGPGFCAETTVSTTSTTPITWEVTVDLTTFPLNAQTITSTSNFTNQGFSGGILTATGVGWNNTVDVNNPRTLSFCAERPPAPPAPAEYSSTIDNDWGTGYCATITVTTTSPTPIVWEVDVDLSTAPLNGTPYNVWNATYSFTAPTMTASGAGWNDEISNSNPTSFGFCANR